MTRLVVLASMAALLGGCFRTADEPPVLASGCGPSIVVDVVEQGSPRAVFTGSDFVVYWRDDEAVQVRRVDAAGREVTAAAARAPADSAQFFELGPHIMAVAGEAHLFEIRGGRLYREVLGADGEVSRRTDVAAAGRFEVASLDADRVAVVVWTGWADWTVLVDDGPPASGGLPSAGTMSWNGADYLLGLPVRLTLWRLAIIADEEPTRGVPFYATYRHGLGVLGFTGSTATHAVAIGRSSGFGLWFEGDEAITERPSLGRHPGVDLAWDGETHWLAVADGAPDDPRDITIEDLATGAVDTLVESGVNDNAPSLAAVAPGELGLTWRHDDEIRFARCSLP